MDRDFRLVQSASAASGQPENAEFHHYPQFADKAVRKDVEHLDEGLASKTYFDAVNVDPPSHYFKNELVDVYKRQTLKSVINWVEKNSQFIFIYRTDIDLSRRCLLYTSRCV